MFKLLSNLQWLFVQVIGPRRQWVSKELFASVLKCTNCSQYPKGQFFTFTSFSFKLLWKTDHKLIFNSKKNFFCNSILTETLTEHWDFTEFLNKLEL